MFVSFKHLMADKNIEAYKNSINSVFNAYFKHIIGKWEI